MPTFPTRIFNWLAFIAYGGCMQRRPKSIESRPSNAGISSGLQSLQRGSCSVVSSQLEINRSLLPQFEHRAKDLFMIRDLYLKLFPSFPPPGKILCHRNTSSLNNRNTNTLWQGGLRLILPHANSTTAAPDLLTDRRKLHTFTKLRSLSVPQTAEAKGVR